ncbi:hypothetical protein V6N13_110815 [Hibiscus sabdariffa]
MTMAVRLGKLGIFGANLGQQGELRILSRIGEGKELDSALSIEKDRNVVSGGDTQTQARDVFNESREAESTNPL